MLTLTKPDSASGGERMQGNRVVSVFLIVIGLCAMAAVMFMTGRFGWSLQDEAADRIASASIHVLVDAGGAALVTASGIMLSWRGWRWRMMGIIALFCALVLVAYSILSVYGFMSTRIAHLEGHKNIVAMQQGDLDWKRKTSISRDVPKSERLYLRQEARVAAGELKNSLAIIPDGQAAAIAGLFSTTSERVQRALVMISSGVGQLIKVACLFIGFSLWPHRLHETKPSGGTDGGGGGREKPATETKRTAETVASIPAIAAKTKPSTQRSATNVVTFGAPKSVLLTPEDKGFRYVEEQIARLGYAPSQAALARVMGASKATASRTVTKWEKQGLFQRERQGKVNLIVRPVGVGGSRYASAIG